MIDESAAVLPIWMLMSDGANYLYLTGDEYRNIFPVWDWTKIPGTTAIQDTLYTGEQNTIAARGTTVFDGGVSDGKYGLGAMDLARGKLVAKNAWFFRFERCRAGSQDHAQQRYGARGRDGREPAANAACSCEREASSD